MHESSYSPPLPLNLSISEREQSFLRDLNGWSLALTGQDPHCWSLHFSPGSDWYRWLSLVLQHSVPILSEPIQWWFVLFQLLETFIHNSCSFFYNHLIDNSFCKFFFHCMFSTLFSFGGTKQFKDALYEQQSGFLSKSNFSVFSNCLLVARLICM